VAVAVRIEGTTIVVRAYHGPEVTDAEREAIDIAGAEIIADYPHASRLEIEFERELPAYLASVPGSLVFLRHGFESFRRADRVPKSQS
jgi:hypothetical protein